MSKDTPKPNTTNSEPITTNDLFQGTVLSDNRFSRFDQEIIDKYFNDDGKKAIEAFIASKVEEARIEPFDFVESCEPDCTPERHAYHQGQWEMAQRIKRHYGYEEYPGGEALQSGLEADIEETKEP